MKSAGVSVFCRTMDRRAGVARKRRNREVGVKGVVGFIQRAFPVTVDGVPFIFALAKSGHWSVLALDTVLEQPTGGNLRELASDCHRSYRHAVVFEPMVLDRLGCRLVIGEPLGAGCSL